MAAPSGSGGGILRICKTARSSTDASRSGINSQRRARDGSVPRWWSVQGSDDQVAHRIGVTNARNRGSTSSGFNAASVSTHQFSTTTNVAAMWRARSSVGICVVVSTLMLHHLPHMLRQQCAREIRRVVKSGGRALVVDFARAQSRSGFLAHFHRHGHVDTREVASQLDEAGFRCVDSGPVGSAPSISCSQSRRHDPMNTNTHHTHAGAVILVVSVLIAHVGLLGLAFTGRWSLPVMQACSVLSC